MPRKPNPRTDLWTPAEDKILTDAGGKLTLAQLQELLPNRRQDSLYKRCVRMGVEWKRRPTTRRDPEGGWSPDEIKVLRDARGALSIYELYLLLPKRSKPAIRNKLEALSIRWRKTQRRPEDQPKPRPKVETYKPPTDTRRCLTCGATFQSWGPGNRLCNAHRQGDGTVW
jgi:hypothetical protein